jgi:hypothetical protein
MVHAVVLFAIFLLASVVVIDLFILLWSWWPVEAGAMRFDSHSVVFLILPAPVGETVMNGVQAIVIGAVLMAIGFVLFMIRRSGRVPGLGGGGTTVMSALAALAGVGMIVGGAYLAATGHLTSSITVTSILPTPVGLLALKFTLMAQWHSIMIGAILMSALAMFYIDGRAYLKMARRSMARFQLPPLRTDNAVISVFRMYMAILAFYIVYFAILNAFTVEPEIPDFDKMPMWKQLHAFAEASVWEEVLSRIFMLGIPLMIYHLWTRPGVTPSWRYVVGGGFRIDTAAFVLITFQALVFAMAHVAGWDLWKVLPTMVSGYAFGYLYLKRGLWASIMLHFTFDYLGMTVDGMAQWGIQAAPFVNIVIGFIALVGLVLLIHYIVIIIKEGPGLVRAALMEDPDATGSGADGKV